MNIRSLIAPLGIVPIMAVGCATGQSPSGTASAMPSPSHSTSGMDHSDGFAFGEPADASDAERTIQIEALDTIRFDPARIEVSVGETVTFEIANTGEMSHEFVLGDAATQDEHQGEMGGMSESMVDGENALSLEPGEEFSLTWTFTQPGTVLYACHVDDHFAAGMVGAIQVGR